MVALTCPVLRTTLRSSLRRPIAVRDAQTTEQGGSEGRPDLEAALDGADQLAGSGLDVAGLALRVGKVSTRVHAGVHPSAALHATAAAEDEDEWAALLRPQGLRPHCTPCTEAHAPSQAEEHARVSVGAVNAPGGSCAAVRPCIGEVIGEEVPRLQPDILTQHEPPSKQPGRVTAAGGQPVQATAATAPPPPQQLQPQQLQQPSGPLPAGATFDPTSGYQVTVAGVDRQQVTLRSRQLDELLARLQGVAEEADHARAEGLMRAIAAVEKKSGAKLEKQAGAKLASAVSIRTKLAKLEKQGGARLTNPPSATKPVAARTKPVAIETAEALRAGASRTGRQTPAPAAVGAGPTLPPEEGGALLDDRADVATGSLVLRSANAQRLANNRTGPNCTPRRTPHCVFAPPSKR